MRDSASGPLLELSLHLQPLAWGVMDSGASLSEEIHYVPTQFGSLELRRLLSLNLQSCHQSTMIV